MVGRPRTEPRRRDGLMRNPAFASFLMVLQRFAFLFMICLESRTRACGSRSPDGQLHEVLPLRPSILSSTRVSADD